MKDAEVRNEQIWLVVGSLMILATVALAAALSYTRDVMIPFVLAIFITAAVAPLVDFQVRRWRLPDWLAVTDDAPVGAGHVGADRCRAHRGRPDDGPYGRRIQYASCQSDGAAFRSVE